MNFNELNTETINKVLSNENLSRILLDGLPYPAMIINKNKIIIYVNKVAQKNGTKSGTYCWDTFAKRTCISAKHKAYLKNNNKTLLRKDIMCTFCLADKALADQKTQNKETEMLDSVYDTFWIPLNNDFYFHYAVDITKQKEELLYFENTAEWLNRAQEIAHLGIWNRYFINDSIWWSDETYRIFGMEPQSKKMDFNNFLSMVFPDDREKIEKKLQLAILSKDFPYKAEYRIIRPDKEIRNIYEEALIERDKNGKPTRIIGIVRDITETRKAELILRNSEERFRFIFEQAAIGVVIADPYSGDFIKANKKFLDIIGYSEEELFSKTFMDITYPEDLEKDLSKLKKLINNKIDSFSLEKRYVRKDGKIVWANITVSHVMKMSNQPNYLVAVIEDINKRKEYELQLKEANKTKDKLFSVISHDLKNTLFSVSTFSKLLRKAIQQKNYSSVEEFSIVIDKSFRQIYNMLITLLEWSLLQSNRIQVRPEKFQAYSLINSCITLVNSSLIQKEIHIEKNIEKNLTLVADRSMIKSVVINLLVNAIKYSQPHGKVLIKGKQTEKNIMISIIDSGIGIKKENIPKLFKSDTLFTTVGTEEEPGFGLGLVICKEFIEKHNGEIKVKSKIGAGSEFTIILPKKDNLLNAS